jgi:hypothetical protein
MWVIPTNLSISYQCVLEYVESKEDLQEHWDTSQTPLFMLKSKPLLWPTLLRAWKRVYWIPHLSGRILKLSMEHRFVEKYTESLQDGLVSPFPWPANKKESKIQDTSGHISQNASRQQTLFLFSEKTSPDTSTSDSEKSNLSWKKWVTELRQESTLRKKLAHHIKETDSSFLQSGSGSAWPTPKCQNANNPGIHGQGGMDLQTKVLSELTWSTPTIQEVEHPNMELTETGRRKTKDGKNSHSIGLADQVKNWPTPDCSDRRSMKSKQQWLSNLVKAWPTPRASEWKGTGQEISGCDSRRDRWPARPGENQYDWEEPRTSGYINRLPKTLRSLWSASRKNFAKMLGEKVWEETDFRIQAEFERPLDTTINGYNFREDLLRAAGNAVVEQTAELAFIDLLNKIKKSKTRRNSLEI